MSLRPGPHVPRATDRAGVPIVAAPDWRCTLPTLHGAAFTLRELRMEDAPALVAALATDEVSRFISPPPSTVEGFARFIQWTELERQAGRHLCFAVVPDGTDSAIGLFQIRTLEPGFGMAEWGFALAPMYWGTDLFIQGAKLVLDFAFDIVHVHRLEARASVINGRGNGALRKLGAIQEGLLRESFFRFGEHHDQVLWSILAEDWRLQRTIRPPSRVH